MFVYIDPTMNNIPYQLSNDANSVLQDTSSEMKSRLVSINPNMTMKSLATSKYQSSFHSLTISPIETIITSKDSSASKKRCIVALVISIAFGAILISLLKCLSSIPTGENTSELDIALPLTTNIKRKSIETFVLENGANVTTILDDTAQLSHISFAVNTNNMENEIMNDGILYKEIVMNLFFVVPFIQFEARRRDKLASFNITKKEIKLGWTRIDVEIDHDKLHEIISTLMLWLGTLENNICSIPVIRSAINLALLRGHDEDYQKKSDDNYVENIIIDDILYNNSFIAEKYVNFIKQNVDTPEFSPIANFRSQIYQMIRNYYVGSNMNIIVYTKSAYIADIVRELHSLTKFIPEFPSTQKTENNVINKPFPINLSKAIWYQSANHGRYLSITYVLSDLLKNDKIYLEYLTYLLSMRGNLTLYSSLHHECGMIENINPIFEPSAQSKRLSFLKVRYQLTTLGALNLETVVYNTSAYLYALLSTKSNSTLRFQEFFKAKKAEIYFAEPKVEDVLDSFQTYAIEHLTLKDYETFNLNQYMKTGNETIKKMFNEENMLIFYEAKTPRMTSMDIFGSDQLKENATVYLNFKGNKVVYYSANITDLSNYTKNESLPTVLANNTPNVFITNKTRITTSSSESEKSEMTPTNIHESKHFTMWYRVRHNYLICRLITHFQFQK